MAWRLSPPRRRSVPSYYSTARPGLVWSGGLILFIYGWQVLVRSAHIPMVSLECVSCKVQSLYEVSHNSYVYLRGSCSNCLGAPRGVNTHPHVHTRSQHLNSHQCECANLTRCCSAAVSEGFKDKMLIVEWLLLLLLHWI